MNKKIFAFIILAALLLGGCSYSKTPNTTAPSSADEDTSKVITKGEKALNKLNELVFSLDNIRTQIGTQYDDLNNQKITLKDFRDKNDELLKFMETLNSNEQSTEFNLSPAEKQSVNFDAVYKNYLTASKDLSDYLYFVNHLKDEKLKAKYQELIINKYDKDIATLKSQLQNHS